MESHELIEALQNTDMQPRSYSGRAMYGDRCVAVTTQDRQSPVTLALNIAEALIHNASDVNEAERLISGLANASVRTDNMGMGVVVYWPDMLWPEGVDESVDEDEDED